MEKYCKDQIFADMVEKIEKCQACKLKFIGQHKCPGLGNLDAKVMFVGEAPGRVDNPDLRCLPFVGNVSSDLLLDIVYELWPHGYDDVFITNVVKCNPPLNRAPERMEIKFCGSWLVAELALVRPKVVVALGRTAANFFQVTDSIQNAKLKEWSLAHQFFPFFPECRLFVFPHPAHILRNGSRGLGQYKAFFRRAKKRSEE